MINTDFVDNDESQDVAVTARSAPIYPISKRPHKRPRDDKDELEYDEYILEKRSSYMYADSKPAVTSNHDLMNTDSVEHDESQEVAVTARSAPMYAKNKRPHERSRDDKDELEYEEYTTRNFQQRSKNAYANSKPAATTTHNEEKHAHNAFDTYDQNVMLRRRPERGKVRVRDTQCRRLKKLSTENDASRARGVAATANGEDSVSPGVHRGRRPRRMLMQQDSKRSLQVPTRPVR